MHLVDLPSCYPPHPGGLEAYAHELHRQLLAADPDLRITVLTSDTASKPGIEHLTDRWTVVRWPSWMPVSPYPVPKPGFHKLLREYCTPDSVMMTHTRFFYHAALASRFAASRGIRRVHIEHGSTPVQSGNGFVRLVANTVDATIAKVVLGKAAHVVAVSNSARDFVRDLSGREPTVVHRGMELPTDLKAEPTADDTVCFVGRLISGKGVADLLDATATLHSTGMKARLRICGDGPVRSALEAKAKTLGLGDHVEFLGAVDHATALKEIAAATVFVNPSWTEGLPTTVLEAAALGAAVVATDVGGTSEILDADRTGWLVPAQQPDALARALGEALGDAELRRSRGDALRATTAERFSWDHAVEVISAMLRGAPVPG
ncbi:glycosyltransferase family 4 protein [Actinokineospora alba]|nr:glycosyltransferase [Actinokineospora alba]